MVQPVVFAHRGASGRYAEHTRAAYLQALAEATDGVECDIHLSRDRQLVLIHDHTLDRTSNATGQVADYTLDELRQFDFHGWKNSDLPADYGSAEQQFLTLPELIGILREYGKPIKLAVECKHPDPFGAALEEELFDLLDGEGWDAATCTLDNISLSFMSFDPAAVERLLQRVPARLVCQLLEDIKVAAVAGAAGVDDPAGTEQMAAAEQFLADGQSNLDRRRVGMAGPGVEYIVEHTEQVERWVAAGLRFRVWTVNSDDAIDLCARLGVAEVTTDWPARTAERFALR
ncbi:glycerophosphodiester phosphodiesterase [Arthrobacter castelli]|uniref:glycerophosphodiester phosphodiesterase n=1 Tax=Arthrobacter castelli TaxID=271431 RepID=UPI00047A70D4|nr:glycerophosphodiester phosphodiesterase family protein [Arthrobacter castelli]